MRELVMSRPTHRPAGPRPGRRGMRSLASRDYMAILRGGKNTIDEVVREIPSRKKTDRQADTPTRPEGRGIEKFGGPDGYVVYEAERRGQAPKAPWGRVNHRGKRYSASRRRATTHLCQRAAGQDSPDIARMRGGRQEKEEGRLLLAGGLGRPSR